MDFSLTDDQRAIEDAARAFAAAELAPHSARWDEAHHFPADVLRQAAGLGFGGLYVREDVGGAALGRLDASIVFEQLSYGDVATAAFLSIHNMASWMIDRFGDEALRQRFLPKLTSMELIASYCLTEPGSGSDAAALSTTARLDGDHYVLNGAKRYITNANKAHLFTVMARTDPDKPGAGGAIGDDFVAKASPDGHTLLVASSGVHACRVLARGEVALGPLEPFLCDEHGVRALAVERREVA